MKRPILLLAVSSLFATGASAQCAFDQQYAAEGPGMYPAVLDPVETCVGCGDHTRFVSIITNTSMLVPNPFVTGTFITLYIDSTKVLNIEGHPAGTTFGTDFGPGPDNLGVWGNSGVVPNQTAAQGCAYVSGDEAAWNAALGGGPNSDGVYPLTITVDARIHSSNPDISSFVPNGTWASDVDESMGGGPIVFDTYEIVVTEGFPVGIRERANSMAVYPNPAHDMVRFDLGGAATAMVELFDLAGTRVVGTTVTGSSPMLGLDGLAGGMYICRITGLDGSPLLTTRLAVTR